VLENFGVKNMISDKFGSLESSIRSLANKRPTLRREAISPSLIAQAAKQDGAKVAWLSPFIFTAVLDGTKVTFWDVRANESAVGSKLVTNKSKCRQFLKAAGVPIARGKVVTSSESAIKFWKRLGLPVAIKPVKGTKGRGVSLNLDDESSIDIAFNRAKSSAGVLVEEYVEGNEYRFLVVNGKTVAVLGKDAPNVVGDGLHTIEKLVELKNNIRKSNPRLATSLIAIDDYVVANLDRQGLSVSSILPEGKKVYLRREANIAVGADTVDLTDDVPDRIKDIAVQAVSVIPGLDWAGVDIIATDIEDASAPCIVLEINSDPGLGGHHYPMRGKPRNVAALVWKAAYNKQRAIDEALKQPLPEVGPLQFNHILVSIVLHGKVTGVGFRRWVKREATRMNLEGWVRNRLDGTVELALSGSQGDIFQLIGALHFGNDKAKVENVLVKLRSRPLQKPGFHIFKTK
jgi:D-alanine-D-alanine ligase-like ATP-grasp enzyme/acylphosphatase